jgi:hypothetical protein
MENLSSVLLPQSANPTEIQKMGLDLLAKIKAVKGAIPGPAGSGLLSISTDTVLKAGDGVTDVLVSTGTGTIYATLPMAKSVPGRRIRVWKYDAAAGGIIIKRDGTDTIVGVASDLTMSSTSYPAYRYSFFELVAEGDDWMLDGGPVARTGTNGLAVMWPDGTMLCAARSGSSDITNVAAGNVYISAARTMTFPLAFAAKPYIADAPEFGATQASGQIKNGSPSSTQVLLSLWSFVNNAIGYTGYIAVGRWR